MGYDVSANGAFGILLSRKLTLGQIYDDLLDAVDDRKEAFHDDTSGVIEQFDGDKDSALEDVASRFVDRLVIRFAELGVEIPNNAKLYWTGDEDSRPGRTDTDADEWIFRFGLFKKAYDYPVMLDSFKQKADWHTWVTGG